MIRNDNLMINKHPELLSEWDYENNEQAGIDVHTVTCGSHVSAWWRCGKYKHSYQMRINHRTSGIGCPYCANKKVLRGFNDLQSKYPELINSEWDYEENRKNGLEPYKITAHSKIKASWKCPSCMFTYMMTINNKVNNHGCPYCSGKKTLKGHNDLQSNHPDLINKEWDWVENDKKGLKPDGITEYSNIKACWHCTTCKGKYETAVCDKIKYKTKCPYCTGRKVLTGYNDLLTLCPELIESSWDWIRNSAHNIYPYEIARNSHIQAYWKCSKCKHKWQTSISARTSQGTDCPVCDKRISKQENQVADFIKNYLCEHYVNMHYTMFRSIKFKKIYKNLHIDTENVLSNDLKSHMLKEVDIYIPELNLAVEYDGDYWHNDEIMLAQRGLTNSEAHNIKQLLCKQADIELIFITEHDWLNDNERMKQAIVNVINTQSLRQKRN